MPIVSGLPDPAAEPPPPEELLLPPHAATASVVTSAAITAPTVGRWPFMVTPPSTASSANVCCKRMQRILAATAMSSLPTLFDLSGQLAVVTGARRGIGLAIAEALAAAGADIVGVSAALEAD